MSVAVPLPEAVLSRVPVPLAELLIIVREYINASRYDTAERLLGHLLAAYPRNGDSLHLKGYIAFKRNRWAEAAALMEQALAAGAASTRQLSNLAWVYRLLGRLDEGLVTIFRAQALDPSDAVSHFNEAALRHQRLEPDACIRAARRAIELQPDLPDAHLQLGKCLLLTGQFAEGWEEYEWRYQISGVQHMIPKTDKPQWDGTPLPEGKHLLLVADQGLGDVIMFARFLPWAIGRCPSIAIATSIGIRPLLERHYPDPTYCLRRDEWPDFVAYYPFSGLPRLAGTRLDSIPPPTPLFRPLPEKLAHWRARLDDIVPAGLHRVAIAWAGQSAHADDHNRSISLGMLAPFGHLPDTAFLAVQKGPAAAQAAQWRGPAPLISLDAQIESFDDTAAILAHSDLLVCVDTSVGHLAGAFGLPAWVMLTYAPDWRWLMARGDSPWYPSLRLFRQPQPCAWTKLIAAVAVELTQFLRAPRDSAPVSCSATSAGWR